HGNRSKPGSRNCRAGSSAANESRPERSGTGPVVRARAEAPRPDSMRTGRFGLSRRASVRVEHGGDGRFTVLQPTRRARQLGQGLIVTGTGLLHTGRTHE